MAEIRDEDLYRDSEIPTLPNLPVNIPGMNNLSTKSMDESLLPKDFYEKHY